MNNKITMDDEHVYRVNGVIVPGVSQLLQEVGLIDENVIRFADPTLGTAVHKACELDDKGVLDIDSCSSAVKSRLEQWRNFKEAREMEIVLNEESLYSKLGFCGTPDRVFIMKGLGYILVDIKTSKVRSKSTKVQLVFYKRLVEEHLDTQIAKVCEVVLDGESEYPEAFIYKDLAKEEGIMRSILNIHYFKKG